MWFGRWVWIASLCGCACSGSDGPSGSVSNAAGATPCRPLEPLTTSVSLDASAIVATGRSADGMWYVLYPGGTEQRLFVSSAGRLLEQPAAGTGEVNEGDAHTFLFSYTDAAGTEVSVQLRRDAAGTRMAVLHGPSSEKVWDIDSEGEQLTLTDSSSAAELPATSTQTFSLDYEAALGDGDLIAVVRPDHAGSYDDFRLFWGAPAALSERKILSFTRARSLDGSTDISFQFEDGTAQLSYSFPYPLMDGALSSGALTWHHGSSEEGAWMQGPIPPLLPDGVQFLCR